MTIENTTLPPVNSQQLGAAKSNPVYRNPYVSPLEMVFHVSVGLLELIEASRETGREFPFATLETFAYHLQFAHDELTDALRTTSPNTQSGDPE